MGTRMHGFGTGDPFGHGWASIGWQRLVAEGLADNPFGPRRGVGAKNRAFGRFVERFGNSDAVAMPHVDEEVAGIFVVEEPGPEGMRRYFDVGVLLPASLISSAPSGGGNTAPRDYRRPGQPEGLDILLESLGIEMPEE